MKNYFGCNECGHAIMKGWFREKDNKILRVPKTYDQRKAMSWWVGDEEMSPLYKEIEDGAMEFWCDKCRAFVNTAILKKVIE